MEKMLFTTNGIGHQRRTAVEIIKIGDDFLGSTRAMMLLAKSRLDFEQVLEEAIEMIIKGVMSNKATIEVILAATGKIVDQGFKDLMCPPRR